MATVQFSRTAIAVALLAAAAEPSEPLQPQQLPQDSDPSSTAAATAAAAAEPPSAAAAASNPVQPQQDSPFIEWPPLPPAYLPEVETELATPTNTTVTTTGTSTSSSSGSPAPTCTLTPRGCSGILCKGFVVENTAEPGGSTTANSVVLVPAKGLEMIDPNSGALVEIATLRLQNGGLTVPAGSKFIMVSIRTKTLLGVRNLNKTAVINLRFGVMWATGGRGPANQAGVFVLITRGGRSSAVFNLWMSEQTVFEMSMQLVGLQADPSSPTGRFVEVLGDGNQTQPAPGLPGTRLYVKQGRSQLVKLMARFCKAGSFSPNCRQPAG
uniref:Pherophorin domain-containing protein n=1 Tax=Tetradesmus obliquus TaxID=3088 RepID=A0A383WCB7_TETOB|eukprot:jgi/Sobl393_1/1863/SZX75277.1